MGRPLCLQSLLCLNQRRLGSFKLRRCFSCDALESSLGLGLSLFSPSKRRLQTLDLIVLRRELLVFRLVLFPERRLRNSRFRRRRSDARGWRRDAARSSRNSSRYRAINNFGRLGEPSRANRAHPPRPGACFKVERHRLDLANKVIATCRDLVDRRRKAVRVQILGRAIQAPLEIAVAKRLQDLNRVLMQAMENLCTAPVGSSRLHSTRTKHRQPHRKRQFRDFWQICPFDRAGESNGLRELCRHRPEDARKSHVQRKAAHPSDEKRHNAGQRRDGHESQIKHCLGRHWFGHWCDPHWIGV